MTHSRRRSAPGSRASASSACWPTSGVPPSGRITATLEYGKTGLPLADGQVKALENTSAVQRNGLVARLETALLSGELEGELFEGLTFAIEANAVTAAVDSEGAAEIDLLTISAKLAGDAGHLLGAGPDVSLTIDGRLSISLGGKLAAKLASVTVAQLEQKLLAKEIAGVGATVDKHARKIKALEAKALVHQAKGEVGAASRLREEIFQRELQVSTGKQQLEGLTGKLSAARQRADRAIAKLEHKVARAVAAAMEKKVVKFVATTLMKVVPVLNVISTIVDVVELILLLKNLASGGGGGDGGGENADGATEGPGAGSQSAPAPADGTAEPRPDAHDAPGGRAEPTPAARRSALGLGACAAAHEGVKATTGASPARTSAAPEPEPAPEAVGPTGLGGLDSPHPHTTITSNGHRIEASLPHGPGLAAAVANELAAAISTAP